MKDRQFKGYQDLRSKLEAVIEDYDWSKEDLAEALRMFEEDVDEFLEKLSEKE